MRFMLVERLVAIERGRRVTAQTVFPASLDVFLDHFPGRPVVPGTLVTEAMGQAAGWLLSCTWSFTRLPMLIAVDQAKFFKPIGPGETIDLTAQIQSARELDYEVDAEARVGGSRVARARLLFRTEPLSGDASDAAIQAWARDTFARIAGDRL